MFRHGTLAIVTLAVVAVVAAHGQDKKEEKKAKPLYVHAVIFYLKKDAPKDAVETFIKDVHEMLEVIPSVKGIWVGRPADKGTPDFAKKDYDVGLVVLFDNYDGLKEYLDHAKHVAFVKKHGKYFETVNVFDFMDQKK